MTIDEQGYAKGFDYQCDTCHKIFHGPGSPADPGHEIPSSQHPRPLSHGRCPECQAKEERGRAAEYWKYKKEHPDR